MKSSSRFQAGFTLVELMVSTAIIGLIMLVLVGMTNQTSQTWKNTAEKIEKFQEARDGFESMTRKLSQATLNTNWDYLDSAGAPRDKNVGSAAFNAFVPIFYGRTSDLRFVSGPMRSTSFSLDSSMVRPGHGIFFQAPFGVVADTTDYAAMDNLLNTWGYFVEAGNDPSRPQFVETAGVPGRWRSRLMEYMLPAEQMSLYDKSDKSYTWFTLHLNDATARPVRVLAENVITLIILPRLSKGDEDYRAKTQGSVQAAMLSPQYIYDSFPILPALYNPGAVPGSDGGMINPKNQLPPILTVTMVAVDERSAQRLADTYCTGAQSQAQHAHGSQRVTGSGSEMLMGLDQAAGKVNPPVIYQNLFTDATRLEDNPNTATPGDGDLYDLERVLTNEKCTYRVFTSNVSIRGAKWSRVK
ncbi:MAG: Verru_Chthon cassette protein C [Chthoniobacter sp.]|nr:Verru_Chthon cassette protein C [Chthoniobacter sp.]